MRLICPNCDAQYEIDGALVPALGRDVECSACGQVWFQHKEPEKAATPASGAAPALSRPLSDSVLSILRDEASRELRNREAERQGSPLPADPVSPPRKDVTAELGPKTVPPFDLPIIDWPATTVAEIEDLPPAAEPEPRQPARPDPRHSVPPLVLPDAEKLAATLHSTRPAPEPVVTPKPVVTEAAPEEPAAEAQATPADAASETVADTPADAVAADEPATLDTPAEAALTEAPAPEATAHEPAQPGHQLPAAQPQVKLPAKITTTPLEQRERAAYRTGFGLATMLAVLALALYFLAPRLAGQGEIGAKIMEWRQEADQARTWLREEANQLLGRQ